MIDLKLINRLLDVSRINISDSQKQVYLKELNEVLEAFKVLEECDEDIMISPSNNEVLREDKVETKDKLKLGNFCLTKNNFVVGPRLK
jgi:aspartyl/glutamyl-tRNA(Asn/Gln) amidotransferase C subunit